TVSADVEQRGQASASTCSSRRRSCAHGTRRRNLADGLSGSAPAACFGQEEYNQEEYNQEEYSEESGDQKYRTKKIHKRTP
ncbi:MAG: hypothetical protein KJ970_02370, partial [Candidatus Eisenbacteria bacterium]|nr:hypothetical protein [Candidatus Eisenbacteria bacterium]